MTRDTRIRLLYICDLPGDIHESRFLKEITSDPGLDVTFVTCEPGKLHPVIESLPLKIIRSPQSALSSRIPIVRGMLHNYRHYTFIPFLKRIIREHRIDVIHSGWLTWSSYEALKTGFHPVLATSYGSDVLDNPYVKNPHNSPGLLRKLKFVVERADLIYSDAEYVAETLVKLTSIQRDKIRVFPQIGVDMSIFRPDSGIRSEARRKLNIDDKKVILSVRNLYPVYSIDTLIRAMPDILKVHGDVVLLIAGDGPMRRSLEDLASSLNVRERIIFLGSLPGEELPAYYNASDLYASTSLSDGSSMCLSEAMSCGLPAMVTDVPSNLEWIKEGHNGWIAKRGDVASVKEKLVQALDSGSSMDAFGKKNYEIAKDRLDVKRNYQRLGAIYRELVRKSTAMKQG